MAVISSDDLELRYSTSTGPGNSTTGGAATSLGGFLSTTGVLDDDNGNVFDDQTAAEAEAGRTIYRCLFVVNTSATATLTSASVYLSGQQPGGGDAAIGLDPAGVSDSDSATAQAASIVAEDDVPSGVAFSTPVTEGNGLSPANVGPGQCFAVWMRLYLPPGASGVDIDYADLTVTGDSQ